MRFIKSAEFNISEPCAVSLGKFDGLHAGHMTLIERIVNSGYKSVAMTFDFSIYGMNGKKNVLFTDEERVEAFERVGVDYLIECPFDDKLRTMSPREFIEMLTKKINVRLIVAGEDFRFGKNRAGDVNTLKDFGAEYGYSAEILSHLKIDGNRVSSTRIIKCIEAGDVSYAKTLLGYPYFLSGTIVHGRHLGTTFGFPTANIDWDGCKILPSFGVYGVEATIDGISRKIKGVCNVGIRPTVSSDGKPDIEVYLIDFDEDIYGRKMKIEFTSFIRPEMKFESTGELIKQMKSDVLSSLQTKNNMIK